MDTRKLRNDLEMTLGATGAVTHTLSVLVEDKVLVVVAVDSKLPNGDVASRIGSLFVAATFSTKLFPFKTFCTLDDGNQSGMSSAMFWTQTQQGQEEEEDKGFVMLDEILWHYPFLFYQRVFNSQK